MEILWGVGLSTLVGMAAHLAGRGLPVVGGPVFGILFGMVAAFMRRPVRLESGIAWSGKKLLQAAIILLGFEMNLGAVARTGVESLAVLVFTLLAAFLVAWLGSRALGIRGDQGLLVGVGTAICGGSAIAAVAPIIEAKDEDVAHAISTIFLFNIAAVFLFPALGRLLGLSERGFGLWAGTAINDTSSVVAAGYSYGNDAGAYATVVKLTRTLFILPISLALAFIRARRPALSAAVAGGGRPGAGEATTAGTAPSPAPRPGLARIFPWFVLGFLLASILRTAGLVDPPTAALLGACGKFLIVVAMAAIGLRTDLVRLARNGARPILLGLACWVAVATVSLAVQAMEGGW